MSYKTIITARSSSKRLKNKIMLNISKKYKTIDILIQRSKLIGLPIILATSTAKSDDRLVNYVKKKYKIDIFRGSLNNKIKRWYDCFLRYNLKTACFVDGDDLLIDYDLYKKNFLKIKKISDSYMLKNPDNIITGAFTYIMNFKFLEKIYLKSKNLKQIDVIDDFYENVKTIKKIKLKKMLKNKKLRFTLDYYDDFIFFKEIFKIFNPNSKIADIIKFLGQNKKISKINFYLNKSWKLNQLKEIKKR